MHIEQLTLTHFRLFATKTVAFQPSFNVVQGHNGTGKSSILEAMFYLSRGRSFRTSQSHRMIQDGEDHFVIHMHMHHPLITPFVLALQRDRQGKIKAKAGGEDQSSLVALSTHLPTLFLDTDSHRLLASGPKHRRQWLDWGLFYGQNRDFYPRWGQYKRALAQRNAALKMGQVDDYWDDLLVTHGEALDTMRHAYVERLEKAMTEIWQACHGTVDCGAIRLGYQAGWSQKTSLREALNTHRLRDQALGYTQVGPHRADLSIHIDDKPAHQYLSQGQQKMLTYALALASGICFYQDTGQHCIYMFDDFCAELDQARRAHIIEIIAQQQSQVILTGILAHDVDDVMAGRMFHRIQLVPTP